MEFSFLNIVQYGTLASVSRWEDFSSLLDEFYDLDNLHYIYGKLAVGDTSDEKVEQIYKNMDAILKTYFYVSDEQVQAIRTADSTQIQLIIEESVKNKYE